MAKKGTTGGPRSRRFTEEDVQRRSEYKSRTEVERMWQKRATYAVIALVAASVLVLLYGLYVDKVKYPRDPITKVNGVKVTTADFEKRVAFERWQVAQQIRDFYVMTGGNLSLYGDQFAEQVTEEINSLANPIVFGSPVLDRMEEQILLEQAAKDRGVTVDEAAIEEQVDAYVASYQGLSLPNPDATATTAPTVTPTPLVSPTPTLTRTPTAIPTEEPSVTPVPTEEGAATEVAVTEAGPTATAAEPGTPTTTPTAAPTLTGDEIVATVAVAADTFYGEAEDGADVDKDVVRDAFYYDALVDALSEDLAKEVEPTQFQANARHILLAFVPESPTSGAMATDEQKADALARAEGVMDALADGESFAALAEAHSDDSGSALAGGDLGWASPDGFVAAFKDTIETAEIGTIVGPVETEYGYHIIQVLGREVRDLSPSELSTAQSEHYTKWLEDLKANAKIERIDDWVDRIPGDPSYDDLLGDILPR